MMRVLNPERRYLMLDLFQKEKLWEKIPRPVQEEVIQLLGCLIRDYMHLETIALPKGENHDNR